MKIIKEDGARPIKNWAIDIEEQALQQAKNLARLPFIASQGVALMADAHSGKGSTVGSVIATDKAIIPATVGVDLGCVDSTTEYLSPTGWKLISEYTEGKIAQYDKDTGVMSFVTPTQFICKPADYFWKLKTKYGVDQMLSGDHRVLYRKTSRPGIKGQLSIISADELSARHLNTVLGFRGRFLTTFTVQHSSSLNLSDDELRVAVMVAADGAFRANSLSKYCVLQFVKERKVRRAEYLLNKAGIEYKIKEVYDYRGHVYNLSFYAPIREKSLNAFWGADANQLSVISDEVLKWDGNESDRVYYTRDKLSADFVQYAFCASGFRGVMRSDERENGGIDYRVFANINTEIGISGTPKSPIEKINAKGSNQYCFVVPSSFWVMRRGGNVAITGNCGMNAARLSLKASDLPDSLTNIRHQIERDVPLGAGGAHVEEQKILDNMKRLPLSENNAHDIISKVVGGWNKVLEKSSKQLGTLGSGNHFIELCIDENQDVWIMLHSGSRGIGNMIGTHFIERAKRRMEQFFIQLPDGDLAYFPEDTDDFREYMAAVEWAQEYALENRKVMMEVVIAALRCHIKKDFTITSEAVNCHHNYVARENHFGRNLWITRKGAIRAREGDLGVIPGSMGQKSYIVRGKGNLDSFCSCSHGSGRKMSRAAARRAFSVNDLVEQTTGVDCRKDESVLDEIPGAYKDIDQVMAAQSDLVEVVHILKQVMCVKGS